MKPQNPWNLSPGEVAALHAMCDTGNAKMAAQERGRSHKTIHAQLWRAMQKMKVRNHIMAVLMWDRYRRSQA